MATKNPYKAGGMFEGASHIIFTNAKKLRQNMTAAEIVLWMHLKNGVDGFKFRRQHPIGNYITDFYCHKVKLIIEIDGSIHLEKDVAENDLIRENELLRWGYNVLRFRNEKVMNNVKEIIDTIKEKITQLIDSQKQNTP